MAAVIACALAAARCAQGEPGPPVVTAVEPAAAPASTAVPVVIRGESFWLHSRASFVSSNGSESSAAFAAFLGQSGAGETALTAVTYVDSQTLTATVPATLLKGVYDLRVVDPSGREGTLPAAFTVLPPCNAPADWWDGAWGFRRSLSVDAAPAQYTMALALDGTTAPTAAAVLAASLPSGDDLRILWRDAAGVSAEIDRDLVSFDATSVEVRFRIQEPAGFPGGSGAYWLYYGAAATAAAAPRADRANVYLWWDDFEAYPVGADGTPAYDPRPPAEWTIVDDAGNHVYRGTGALRRAAGLVGVTLQDGRFEARMKVISPDLTVANTNNDGLLVRVDSLDLPTLDGLLGETSGLFQFSGFGTYTGGAFVLVSSAPMPVVRNQWYALRVDYVGPNFELYVDGVQRNAWTTAPVSTSGVALFGYYGDVVFDDLRVRALVSPEPVVSAGVEEPRCP